MGSADDGYERGNGRERREQERDDEPYYSEGTLVECGTTAGPFAMLLHKDWSPKGYERAIELFDRGFYDHSHFFRVVPHFLAQFGIRYVCNFGNILPESWTIALYFGTI